MIPQIQSTHDKYLDPSQSINPSKQQGSYKSKMNINNMERRVKLENIHNDGDKNSNFNKQELYFQEQILKNMKNQQQQQKKHPPFQSINPSEKFKQQKPSTENGQQRIDNGLLSLGKYSNKIQNFHLQQASTIQPSIFQHDYNDHFSQAKPLQIKNRKEQQYNPSNTKNRNLHLKSGDIRYHQAIPSLKQADQVFEINHQASMEKKRIRQLPSIARNSNNFLSLHQSSNIILKNTQGKNLSQIYDNHLKQPFKAIFNPINLVQNFDFVREKKCGINYYYPSYTIQKEGAVLISARKQTCSFNSTYHIQAGDQDNVVTGFLKGNFAGTEFNLYQNNKDRDIQELVCTIIYDVNCGCGPSFRKSEVYINNSKNNAMFQGQTKRKNLKSLFEQGYTSQIYKLKTKEPTWNENQKCYTMGFGGKGKIASIKNMILISQQDPHRKKFLFCKVSEDRFYIEAKNPLNLFIIMGILMSSFDFKLLCQ